MRADRTRWEARYRAGDRPHDGGPSPLLPRWLPRASTSGAAGTHGRRTLTDPARARALDVATGLGRNALYLAHAGYEVDAIDISPTALREAARRARRAGLRGIRWVTADLDRWRPARGRYDVVVNTFYLNRRLIPALRAAVRPGGLLIFETHLAGADGGGPPGRRRRLQPGELRRALRGWTVLYARDGLCRDRGRRLALGRIVARRPRGPARKAPARPVRRRQTADRWDSSPAS